MTARPQSRPPDAATVVDTPGGRRSVFLSALAPPDLEIVLGTASLLTFEAHDPILHRLGPDDALHILLEGAAIELLRAPGSVDPFARPIGIGELIGLTMVLLDPSYTMEARTLTRCLSLRIPGPSARSLAQEPGPVARAFSQAAVAALAEAEMDRAVLVGGDAMTKITRRLNELAAQWGRTTPLGVEIDLPLTQEQLGTWAGVSRETTVKCLQMLRDQGVLSTSRRHIRIDDLGALQDVMLRRGGAEVASRPR